MPDRLSPAMRRSLVRALDREESGLGMTEVRGSTAFALERRGFADVGVVQKTWAYAIRLTDAGRAEARRIREEEQRG